MSTDTDNQITKLSQQPIVDQMSRQIGVDGMMLLHTMQTMLPKGTNFATLMTCVSVASDLGLNPMTKQIYFMPTKGGQIQPIVSVDGWIAIANRHDDFDGWGEFTPKFKDDGTTLLSMTGTMYHKHRDRPTVITEYFDECSKGGGPVWRSHPMRMMRNRTINQLVRVALGISGVMDPDEFQQWQQQEQEPIDITPADPRNGEQLVMRGETRKRPASGAFKDTGGAELFNELKMSIECASTIKDLEWEYDNQCLDGTPWAMFPAGWARLLQEAYYYQKIKLQKPRPVDDEEILTDQEGFVDMIASCLSAADDRQTLREIITSNASLTRRCSPEIRSKVSDLYREAMA
jgi:hypothetical protein